MAVVEIRCPRCGSISHLKNEETHEYCCEHCSTTFVFVDTTKQRVVHDTVSHNCPLCGRPVKVGESYLCKWCGTEYLCEECVQTWGSEHIIVCNACIKQKGYNCDECRTKYSVQCVVCGKKKCAKHADDFDIEIKKYSKKLEENQVQYKALYCTTCHDNVCNSCYNIRSSFLGGRTLICKKCGSELKIWEPESKYHERENEINYY